MANIAHHGDQTSTMAETEMHSGIGAPNGPTAAPFDRWFRYPAGFAPGTLDECFAALSPETSLIVDPFAGVCTTGMRSCAAGIAFRGIEAHPLIGELAALKFARPTRLPSTLIERAQSLTLEASSEVQYEHPLVLRSFPSDSLVRLASLRQRIQTLSEDPWRLHLKWCLLGALRDCASVGVGWPYQRPSISRTPRFVDAFQAFIRRARWMAEDLESAPDGGDVAVHVGDARERSDWSLALDGRCADAIITSPPYLNNFDYADATRLELYFWGTATSWEQMTSRIRSGMMIASTQQTRRAMACTSLEALSEMCPTVSPTVKDLISRLEKERSLRPRGKEYDQLLPCYLYDIARVIANMRLSTTPNALVAIVLGDSAPYGVFIDTPALISQIAQGLGFISGGTKQLRQRGLRWKTNAVRHGLALSEQLVLLRSPGIC